MSKRTDSPGSAPVHGSEAATPPPPHSPWLRRAYAGLGSLGSGAVTSLSMAVVTVVSASVGVVIAREFGRTDETDGFLAAYGVFIVITIAAQAIRIAVLPQFARAWSEGRLAGEMAGEALALAAFAVPLVVAAEVAAQPLAALLTGHGAELAQDTAADALRWMVPAACVYLFSGLAASGLAARDDYVTAALGYGVASIAGLTLILLRVEPDGIIAIAWGMSLNTAICLLIPATVLAAQALRARMPPRAVQPTARRLRARLAAFGVGASLPLGLQLLYVVCLPFAGRLGTGAATSFVYAYLAAASLIAVTAGSLGLVTAVPLERSAVTAQAIARHVVSASWLALVLVGGAAGIFAVVGGDLVEAVLGGSYGDDVGTELGLLVVTLSPWMIASIGVSVAFPLAFVSRRTRTLPSIAVGVLLAQVPLAWAGVRVFELEGLAIALAISTFLAFAALLSELGALVETARGFLGAAAMVAVAAGATFGVAALVLEPVPSALVGLGAYVVAFAAARPRGLVDSMRYLRALA